MSWLAMVRVNSPVSRIQPFSAPSPLTTTNSESQRPLPAPRKRSSRSANGASEAASSCWGIKLMATAETAT